MKFHEIVLSTKTSKTMYNDLFVIGSPSSNTLQFLGNKKIVKKLTKAIHFPSLEAAKQFVIDSYGATTLFKIYRYTRISGVNKFETSLTLEWSN